MSVQAIMRYALARLRKEDEERAYRFYVTDCLKMISRNTAAALREGGQYISLRYSEMISRKAPPKPESGAEIAARVITAVCSRG